VVNPLWVLANIAVLLITYQIWTYENHWWLIFAGAFAIAINYGYYKTRNYWADRAREMEKLKNGTKHT